MNKNIRKTKLVRLLLQLDVSYAKLENNTIYVELEHIPLPENKLKIVDSEPYVGCWDKEEKIRIDNDIRKNNWLLSLAVHEVVEKWIWNTFFRNQTIAESYPVIHGIAEDIERKYHYRKWGAKSWKDYSSRVEYVFLKESLKNRRY